MFPPSIKTAAVTESLTAWGLNVTPPHSAAGGQEISGTAPFRACLSLLPRLEWNALAAEGGKRNTLLLRYFEAVVYHPRFLGGSRVPVRFFSLRGRIQQETGATDHDDDES